MMSLQEYRTKSASLADFLPWVALVGPGVVLNKDGSFQRTARFRGPDLDSATPAELVAVTSRLNNALRRLGSGWAVFVEAQRTAAQAYPQSRFPDPVSALVDRERREQFREEDAHFESGYYLTLLWMPPPEEAARAEGWLYEGKASTGVDPKELVKSFADRTDRVLHLVEGFMPEAAWLDDAATRNEFFSGLYFSSQAIPFQTTDLYAFHLHEENAAGVSNFVTFGTRHKGDPTKLCGWDYTVELVGQMGQLNGKSLTAYAYHLEGGYNWLKTPWKPRLALEYSAGSGDSNPNDGHAHTFQNLFPTNHPPYGFMDLFSWQNMQNVALRLAANPTAKTKTTLDFHSFWLTTTGDAWYRANGTTTVRPVSPNANSHAGCEMDLTVSTKLTPHLDLLLGYSHFFAGAYLAATGPSDDADFGYCMLTLNY